jgi:hypothetical protein
MSLINDALKQARQSQQPNPPSGQPPLRPVEPVPHRAVDWFLPLAVVALAGVAAFFIGLALSRHKPATVAKAPELSAARPAMPATVVPPSAVRATNASAASNTVAAAPSVSGMKLQGVVYGEKSWAIVDGKTVYVGDSVGGFRVKAISENGITLESPDGSDQKLGLGE